MNFSQNLVHYAHTKRSLFIFLCLLCFSLCCQATPTLLVLGDSLSAAYQIPPESGWVALLENKLKATYPQGTIINSSIVGDTTANGLNRLPALLTQYHPDIVLIELGGNDGLRGLPITTIKSNLEKMIALSLNANAKILLVGIKLPPNYGASYIDAFYNNYQQLSTEHAIPLVPFFLEKVATNSTLMQADKIHPTAQAQPILLENVWPYLAPLLSSIQ